MRILILNWRDIKNPKSGGAEILTHEIIKRWVNYGHEVTLFSSFFKGAKSNEIIDGVSIVRKGHPDIRFLIHSVHFQAYLYYKENNDKFDVVVDEIHGVPFFTPWYVKKKKVVLVCEVAGDLWIKMFGHFFGSLGRFMEQIYARFIYKDISFMTISNSTKEDLIKEGVNHKYITVLPMGLTYPNLETIKTQKEKNPTLIFVGRISKSKGVEDAIRVLSLVLIEGLNINLWIIGDGDKKYLDSLKKMAKDLNILDKITFWGFVSQEKKFELMKRAHFLLAPSLKEGWGLIVPEAGLVGTPSIGYSVAGLKDVILNHKTGYLTSINNPDEIAKIVIKGLRDDKEYEKLCKAAKELSLSYDWNNTAKIALQVIERI